MQATLERITYTQTSINFLQLAIPAFDAPWHCHPEVELTRIVRGEGMRFVGDSREEFRAGDLLLLGPKLPHFWHCQDSPASRGGPAEADVCHFLPSVLGKGFWELPEFRRVSRLLERSRCGLVVERELAVEIGRQMDQLREAPPALRLLRLLEILVCLADHIGDLHPLASADYRPSIRDSDGDRLERVFRLVNEHFIRPIPLEEGAQAAALSRTAFCRYFRSRTGKTFSSFVNEVRIGNACRRLLNSDETIISIAYDCGFRNLSNFNRRFREITGTTPRDYRAGQSKAPMGSQRGVKRTTAES
jgi:AraC-like DNA-binding protein